MGFTITPNENGIVINGNKITFPENINNSNKTYTVTYVDDEGCSATTSITVYSGDTCLPETEIEVCVTSKGQIQGTGVGDWYTSSGFYRIDSITVNGSIYNPPGGIDVFTRDACNSQTAHTHYDNYSEVGTNYLESEDTTGYRCDGEYIDSISFKYKDVELTFGQYEGNATRCKTIRWVNGEYKVEE